MKIRFNSRIALFYPAGFEKTEELESLLRAHKIEMRIIDASALSYTAASLAGYIDSAEPTQTYDDEENPNQSTLVFSGLTEQRLNNILDALREAKLPIGLKAVLTGENRSWAFGALIKELLQEKAEVEKESKDDPAKE
ncbi:MAG: DUF3783 domain-containing protein [Oscillospiraceae bacterium]